MKPIISVKNLYKKYKLKHFGRKKYNSLREDLTNLTKQLFNNFKNPQDYFNKPDQTEEFYALNGINFEIMPGERLGIIGRNGAGKSTLLKVISRIIEPTKGNITIRGGVSSLLEVGTGFHPELTGRENIFLNGAILGMKKAEIISKFDEIVAFAEVEKFLDTPVKHFSSGMYARLAFAVASNLEPDVLIIDEILSVGDAQFQKKCIGKLDEVGKSGRTVIFVSHSMPTVASLCSRAILLESGKVINDGLASDVIMHYYTNNNTLPCDVDFSARHIGDSTVRLIKGQIRNGKGNVSLEVKIDEPLSIEMTIDVLETLSFPLVPNFWVYSSDGTCAFVTVSSDLQIYKKGRYISVCNIPAHLLNEGTYFISLAVSSFGSGVKVHFLEKDALSLIVIDVFADTTTRSEWVGPMPGLIRPKLKWSTLKI